MKSTITRGVAVILVTLGLFALSQKVKAGTPDELAALLGDTPVVYQGVCYFTEEGKLTFSHDKMKTIIPCIVGMKLPENDKDHFVLLFSSDQRTPLALIVFHEATGIQETLWTAGQ